MPSRHAVLSASSAHRWLACTPSARLSEQFPDTETPFAKEGTIAHSYCEAKLSRLLGQELSEEQKELLAHEDDDEMEECTDAYVDFVVEEWNAAKAETPDAKLFVEQELDFADYVPEGFGTSDAVIASDTVLEVIDFKYGKGVPVEGKNNPQLRLYALGAYLALGSIYDFDKVKTVVFQPRLSNIGGEELTVDELLRWAEEYVKPRAQLAFKGEGEYCIGDHCRFCKAGGVCRARVEEAFDIVELSDQTPATIDDSEIPAILDKLDNAEKWIAAIRKYAEEKAITERKKWPGYKLVEGRTMRKIVNQIEALNALEEAGYSSEDVTNVKLKGLSELEKLLGKAKFSEVLSPYVVKPQGAPVLVKESDRRPEYNPVEQAFKEEIK